MKAECIMKNAEWKTVALGDLVERAQTWNPSRSPSDEVFDYIDLSAVDQDAKLITEAREVSCGEAPSRARQLVARGDVLVSTVRPNLNGVARVPDKLDRATASTGFCVLRARESKFDGGYLFHWVKSPAFVADMVNKATGASYPAVSDRIIFDSRIPLPPLAEQRRIAEVLDRAEALRAKRRAALAQLDSLTQSLFLDLFGDPATNPKGWPNVELGEVVKLVGGYAFKSDDFAEEGCAVVRISNLTGDGINLTDIARIPRDKLSKGVGYKIQPGEILIAMSGATTGKLGVVPLELSEDLYQNQRVGNYRIRDGERIQREFLLGLLRSPFYQRFLWQLAAGVAQPNVSGWQLESAVVPLPPIEMQREFARRVTAVERLKTAHRASLAELDALFATLQHRAFRGEL